MRRSSPLFVLAILISGCGGPQPDSVYVDMERVLASEKAPTISLPPMPSPPAGQSQVTISQKGFPATTTSDRSIARLELAKRLIAENREQSIESVTRLLKRIYLAQAEDRIARQNRDAEPSQSGFLDEAFADLHRLFEAYAEERGPLLASLNILADGNMSTNPVLVAPEANATQRYMITRANAVRAQLREVEARYDARATELLAEAQTRIDAELTRLRAEAARIRLEAEDKALSDARSQVNQAQAPLDVEVRRLIPATLPPVAGAVVTVPGTGKLPDPPRDEKRQIFGSLEERRRLADRQVEIWIATTGKKRSLKRSGADDATDEFLQWRSANRIGP